jgi:hypothetical protein
MLKSLFDKEEQTKNRQATEHNSQPGLIHNGQIYQKYLKYIIDINSLLWLVTPNIVYWYLLCQ